MNNIIIPFEFFLLKLFLKIRIVLIFPLNFFIQNPYLIRLLNITLPKYKEKIYIILDIINLDLNKKKILYFEIKYFN